MNGNVFYRLLLQPRAKNKDLARREFILNVLLAAFIVLAIVSNVLIVKNYFSLGTEYGGISPDISIVVLLIFLYLYFASRKGYSKIVAYLIITLLVGMTFMLSIKWGSLLPQAALLYAFIVIISGILINARTTFFVTILISGFLITLSYLQTANLISYDSAWRQKIFDTTDTIAASTTLGVIAVASWLFNREIEKALQRARGSEKALKEERDLLEVKVEERTKELKKVQLEKILHLYHLADFGRMTAGLFHDIVNPLTTVSLNLERLNRRNKSSMVKQAVQGTKRMESFVQAVRKQIQKQEVKMLFSPDKEIAQAIEVLVYKAKAAKVAVHKISNQKIKTYGNPLRFNQLVTNLLGNAIDACETVKRQKNRKIIIKLSTKNKKIILIVQDPGCGMAKKNIKKVFDPFFTTKSIEKGTGIGLSICKNIVEKEFGGKIKVKSKEKEGAIFTVTFPIRKRV